MLTPVLSLTKSAGQNQNISLDELELYAKLYFKLANESENSQHLEYAIDQLFS